MWFFEAPRPKRQRISMETAPVPKEKNRTQKYEDPASCLPFDVVQNIASFLRHQEVIALECSSREWRLICRSNRVWYSLSCTRWPSLFPDPSSNLDQIRAPDLPFKSWKEFYAEQHKKMKSAADRLLRMNYKRISSDGTIEQALKGLASLNFSFIDVELFLFRQRVPVFFNYVGLRYASSTLQVSQKHAMEALRRRNIQDKKFWIKYMPRFYHGPSMWHNECFTLLGAVLGKPEQPQL